MRLGRARAQGRTCQYHGLVRLEQAPVDVRADVHRRASQTNRRLAAVAGLDPIYAVLPLLQKEGIELADERIASIHEPEELELLVVVLPGLCELSKLSAEVL